jgi:hypothetical protein
MNMRTSKFDDGLLWAETTSGIFLPLAPSPDAVIAFTNNARNALVQVGTTTWRYTKDGAIIVGDAAASAATQVYQFGVDSAITVTNAAIKTEDIVEQSVTSTVDTINNIAASGVNFVASGVHSVVQQSVDTVNTVATWLGFAAQSPTFASFAVNLPQNAAFLDFDLTVTDPGNPDDQLLVGIGNDVIGQVDLASVEQSGTQSIKLAIGQYAGAANQTLSFYMPSSVSSTAQFVVGNIRVGSLAVDRVPGDFNFDGHVNSADISAMLTALTDVRTFKSTYGVSDLGMLAIGDINHDGSVTNTDIQALLNSLIGGGGSGVSAVEEANGDTLIEPVTASADSIASINAGSGGDRGFVRMNVSRPSAVFATPRFKRNVRASVQQAIDSVAIDVLPLISSKLRTSELRPKVTTTSGEFNEPQRIVRLRVDEAFTLSTQHNHHTRARSDEPYVGAVSTDSLDEVFATWT